MVGDFRKYAKLTSHHPESGTETGVSGWCHLSQVPSIRSPVMHRTESSGSWVFPFRGTACIPQPRVSWSWHFNCCPSSFPKFTYLKPCPTFSSRIQLYRFSLAFPSTTLCCPLLSLYQRGKWGQQRLNNFPRVNSSMVEVGFKPGLCNYKANIFNHQREGKEVFISLVNHIDFVMSTWDAMWRRLWDALGLSKKGWHPQLALLSQEWVGEWGAMCFPVFSYDLLLFLFPL